MTNPNKFVEIKVRQIIADLPMEFTTAQIRSKYPNASLHSIGGVIKRLIRRCEIERTEKRVHIASVKTTYAVYRRTNFFNAEVPNQKPQMTGDALSQAWGLGNANQKEAA